MAPPGAATAGGATGGGGVSGGREARAGETLYNAVLANDLAAVESMLEPLLSDYVRSLSPDRFLDNEWNAAEAQARAKRIYETYYGLGH